MARVCAAGSPIATGLPPEPAVVPPTATILPTRTAREKPMIGSYGLPEETQDALRRMLVHAALLHQSCGLASGPAASSMTRPTRNSVSSSNGLPIS